MPSVTRILTQRARTSPYVGQQLNAGILSTAGVTITLRRTGHRCRAHRLGRLLHEDVSDLSTRWLVARIRDHQFLADLSSVVHTLALRRGGPRRSSSLVHRRSPHFHVPRQSGRCSRAVGRQQPLLGRPSGSRRRAGGRPGTSTPSLQALSRLLGFDSLALAQRLSSGPTIGSPKGYARPRARATLPRAAASQRPRGSQTWPGAHRKSAAWETPDGSSQTSQMRFCAALRICDRSSFPFGSNLMRLI